MRISSGGKSFLMVMGAIFVALILAACVVGIGFFIRGKMIDRESAAYVNDAAKAIVSEWDVDALLQRAHPSMTANTKPDAYAELFDKIRAIGKLKNFNECEGESSLGYAIGRGIIYSATYVCKEEFDNAPAQLTFALIKDNDWQIRAINIDSPFFSAPKQEDAQ
jgi:hypothetical protein